jgi:single-strand DNA-binding protein
MHITTIIGNIGRDPEIRAMKNGGKVANIAVAVNEYRGKDEDPVTHWYNVVGWGPNAETAEGLSKGDRVVVVGKMVTRKWEDQKGNTRYSTELVADGWTGVIAAAPAPETKGAKKSSPKKQVVDDDQDFIPFAWIMTVGIGVASLLSSMGQYVS